MCNSEPRLRSRAPALLLTLFVLSACSGQPAEPAVQSTPAPTPKQTTQVLGDQDLLGARLQIRVLAPASGRAQAEAAIEIAFAETERVAGLPEDSPELAAAPTQRLPYAVDRAADLLTREGTTDFLVTAEPTFRARGSQDGSSDRGWRVGVPGRSDHPSAPRSLVLKDQALHWQVREAVVWIAVGQRAVGAARAAGGAAEGDEPMPGYELSSAPTLDGP